MTRRGLSTQKCAPALSFCRGHREGDFAQLWLRLCHAPRSTREMVRCAQSLARGRLLTPRRSLNQSPEPPLITTAAGDPSRTAVRGVGSRLAKHPRSAGSWRRRAIFAARRPPPPPRGSSPAALPSRSPAAPLSQRRLLPRRRGPPRRRPPTSALGPAPALRPAPLRRRVALRAHPPPSRAPRSPPTRRCGQRRRWAPSSSRTAPSRSGSACARATGSGTTRSAGTGAARRSASRLLAA